MKDVVCLGLACFFGLASLFSLPPRIVAQVEAVPAPRPAPASTLPGEGFIFEAYFSELRQGDVGLVRVTGDITAGRLLLRGREYPLLKDADGDWYALLVADIDAQARPYPLSILVGRADGTTASLEAELTITPASFLRQVFTVPANRAYLIDPEIERREFARLDALIAPVTPERLWSASGFRLPIEAEFTSAFGQYRILNDVVQTRHTGWDQSAPVGTPVGAIGSGVVVYAGQLDIRGNYILLDHGWGVYSGYAHLSQMNVERGQTVQAGQIIGMSGNTGRSSGPHLHWEVAINGEWIDSLNFLDLWLPVETASDQANTP